MACVACHDEGLRQAGPLRLFELMSFESLIQKPKLQSAPVTIRKPTAWKICSMLACMTHHHSQLRVACDHIEYLLLFGKGPKYPKGAAGGAGAKTGEHVHRCA